MFDLELQKPGGAERSRVPGARLVGAHLSHQFRQRHVLTTHRGGGIAVRSLVSEGYSCVGGVLWRHNENVGINEL